MHRRIPRMSNSIAYQVLDNYSFIFFCLCVCIYGHFLQSQIWYHLSRNPQKPIISLVYHKVSALEKDCSVLLLALNKWVFQPVWCNNERYQYPRASPGPRRLCLLFRPKGRGISPCFPGTRSVMEPS